MSQIKSERQETFDVVARRTRTTLVGDTLAMLRHNKKWWLLPIFCLLLLISVLLLLSGTAAAPFIYTLF
jgi:hypothetical protein